MLRLQHHDRAGPAAREFFQNLAWGHAGGATDGAARGGDIGPVNPSRAKGRTRRAHGEDGEMALASSCGRRDVVSGSTSTHRIRRTALATTCPVATTQAQGVAALNVRYRDTRHKPPHPRTCLSESTGERGRGGVAGFGTEGRAAIIGTRVKGVTAAVRQCACPPVRCCRGRWCAHCCAHLDGPQPLRLERGAHHCCARRGEICTQLWSQLRADCGAHSVAHSEAREAQNRAGRASPKTRAEGPSVAAQWAQWPM